MKVTISLDNWIDLVIEVKHHTENDGIGAYEFWGARGFDRGTDYEVIDDVKIIDGFEESERAEIEKYIEDNWDDVCEIITQKAWL